MNIVRKTTEYLVVLDPPRVIKNSDGISYEVHRVTVERTAYTDLPESWEASVRGYKLTKAGDRSQAAPHALPVVGYEAPVLEDEAIDFVKAQQ